MSEFGKWEPIETAPKDGSEFLAWDCEAKRMDVCSISEFPQCSGKYDLYQSQMDGELGPGPDEFGYDQRNITHWMPLPPAP